MNKLILSGILSSLLLTACYQADNVSNHVLCQEKDTTITINNSTLNTELACSDNQKSFGLMYRKELEENSGMLFIYNDEQHLSFWMKKTFIPLSIAYIDSNGKIVDIFDIKPLDETPVTSSKKVKYALEVNQGWFEKNNIQINDVIVFK